MIAGYSTTVLATDLLVHAVSPQSEVVEGNDVTFDWYLSGDVVPQSRYELYTSAGWVGEDTPITDVTLIDFPYGYGWWWVEVYKGDLKWKYGNTSAIQFHHEFPDDWTGFEYSTTFKENGRLEFIELQRDYTIDLSEKFLIPENLPDDYESEAGFYESWSKSVSEPSMNWDFISFDAGELTIKQGYRWDGASYPCKDFVPPNPIPHCIDDTFNIRSSLIHDALYDLMRMEYLIWDQTQPDILGLPAGEPCEAKGSFDGYANRKMADMLLYMIGMEEGQSKSLALLPIIPLPIVGDGAVLNQRGAEQDWFLMRQTIVAPATCDESRLALWKYHVSQLTATASDGQVELNWKPANDAGKEPDSHQAVTLPHPGYDILRDGVVIGSVSSNSTSYTDYIVANDSTYVYQIERLDYPDWGDYSNTAKVTVINVAPTVSIDSVDQPNPQFILPVVHTLTFNGSFTDPGWMDTHSATWDFDDGTIVAGTLAEENDPPDSTGNTTSQHAYSAPGNYTVTLSIIDNDGGVGTDTRVITVISSEEALSVINKFIQDLPEYAFKNKPDQRKNTYSNKLDAVIKLIAAGVYQDAINKLHNDLRAKGDGSIDGSTKNDWITDPEAQEEICKMIDDLIAYLETLL